MCQTHWESFEMLIARGLIGTPPRRIIKPQLKSSLSGEMIPLIFEYKSDSCTKTF